MNEPANAQPWMVDALCRNMADPDLFFGDGLEDSINAKKVCAMCGVIAECRAYSFGFPVGELHGVWGGLSRHDRREKSEQRNAEDAA